MLCNSVIYTKPAIEEMYLNCVKAAQGTLLLYNLFSGYYKYEQRILNEFIQYLGQRGF